MTQTIDLEELAYVAAVMERAHRLLDAEEKKLSPRTADGNEGAGSPHQTLLGAGELTRGADDAVRRIALAIGYACAGLHSHALRAWNHAHAAPRSVPGGTDRMARPLSSGTIEALKLVRQVSEFFGEGLREHIDRSLAAPEATWPPADWKQYDEERMKSAASVASGRLAASRPAPPLPPPVPARSPAPVPSAASGAPAASGSAADQ
ncbi:hypothetical protein A6A06_15935 [Streptomyces sp. CB02923]|uniref:hypothetical protein n=1 Tax=Streptomyces sp. CB02923 TaxID=1718985 RepID=UPI00093E7513|nr:hypothetical protein [Streptomyces sp. CB02923]OKI02515.1 hypothetical protein A6A06_15935 [Streptomyces sp. CB02923]